MKKLLIVGLIFASAQVVAHHATVTNFTQNIITVTGKVEQIRFQNPHSSILMKVADEEGEEKYWLVESDARTTYEKKGWSLDSIRVGSEITVSGREGRRDYTMYLTRAELEDGTVFTSSGTE